MEQLKAIDTEYKGYRFRSRLEARWAVFFDALNIKYLYEPEGFELSDGTWYLPDFYLPESKTFFEVKGVMKEKDQHKIDLLLKDSGKHVVIGYDDFKFSVSDFLNDKPEFDSQGESAIVRCSECGNIYFLGMIGSWKCRCCGAYDGDHYLQPLANGDGSPYSEFSTLYDLAVKKARQARFEHGEKGG